jgi:hypothetical protein
MRKALLFFIAVVACAGHGVGQVRQAGAPNLIKEALIKDIDEYRDGIDKNHIDPYTSIRRRDFFSQIADIDRSAESLDGDELLVKLLQVNALIADGHTNVQTRPNFIFPLLLQWFEEGYFVVATNDDNRKYYHSRILAVNDIPVEEVVKKIATLIPETNPGFVHMQAAGYLTDAAMLHGLQISAERGKVAYTVITAKGDTERVMPQLLNILDRNQVTGVKPGNFLRNSMNGRFWFRYIDSSNTVYFNYRSCFDDGKFGRVIDDLKQTIETRKPAKIVIDMRFNSGGNSNLLMPFIECLSKSELNRNGGIYVLIGSKTYSSAVLDVLAFKTSTNALFVGEETGENAEHYGEVKFFTLSNTQLRVSYSTKHFTNEEHYSGPIKPDVAMVEKFADYDKDVDAVVDYVLRK